MSFVIGVCGIIFAIGYLTHTICVCYCYVFVVFVLAVFFGGEGWGA